VLASARASLNNPSRPRTPRELDARTSLHSRSQLEKDELTTKAAAMHSVLAENLRLSMNVGGGGGGGSAVESRSGISGLLKGSRASKTTHVNGSSSSTSSSIGSSLGLLLCDLQEAMLLLESHLSLAESPSSISTMQQTLGEATPSIDKLTKLVKASFGGGGGKSGVNEEICEGGGVSKSAGMSQQQKAEVVSVCEEARRVLLRILQEVSTSLSLCVCVRVCLRER